jgi:hypothetical protein
MQMTVFFTFITGEGNQIIKRMLNLELMTSPFNIVQANLIVHRLVLYGVFFTRKILLFHSQWLTSVTIYRLLTTGS